MCSRYATWQSRSQAWPIFSRSCPYRCRACHDFGDGVSPRASYPNASPLPPLDGFIPYRHSATCSAQQADVVVHDGDHVGVLSNDGGTCFIDFVHAMRDWCFACLDGGGDPGGVRGPRTTVLGDGLFEKITLADGSGVAPACINIWECTPDGVELFDWSAGFNSQFNADDLIQWLGQGDDMRTLSILANGTLFLHPDADTPPPHHVRLMPNQSSYGEAIESMGEEIRRWRRKGTTRYGTCAGATTPHARRPSPTSHLPSWNAPILGVDKPNGQEAAVHEQKRAAPRPGRGAGQGAASGCTDAPTAHEVLPHNHLTGCASFLPLVGQSPARPRTRRRITSCARRSCACSTCAR